MIDLLSQATLDPGDEIVCGWPSFPSYVLDAAKLGATTRRVPLRDGTYDLDGLLAAIGPRTKLVYVCHPNNPTGTANGRRELESFLDGVPGHVLVVLDQAYFEYIDDPDYRGRDRGALQARPPRGGAADVLQDLRARRAACRLRRGARRRRRRDEQGAQGVRRHRDRAGRGAREHRRRGRDRAPPRRERRGPRTARDRAARARARAVAPSLGNFLFAEVGDGRRMFDSLLRRRRDRAAARRGSAHRRRSASPSAPTRRIDFFADALGQVLSGESSASGDPVSLRGVPRRPLARQLAPLGVTGFRLLFLSTLGLELRHVRSPRSRSRSTSRTARTPASWVGAVLVVEFLPTIFVGLTLGPLLDRLRAGRSWSAPTSLRVGVFAALPFATSAGQIVALALVAGLATGFFRPAVYAGVPNLVPDESSATRTRCCRRSRTSAGPPARSLGGVLDGGGRAAHRVLGQRGLIRRLGADRHADPCARAPERDGAVARPLDGPQGRRSHGATSARCSPSSSAGASLRSASAASACREVFLAKDTFPPGTSATG